MLALGHARLVDYQDARYADLYRERISRVLAAERTADPAGDARSCGDARSRPLSRVVDGVRRCRPRRRSQEPRIAHRARAKRGEGGATRRPPRLRPLQAGRSGACGFAACADWRCAEALGSRADVARSRAVGLADQAPRSRGQRPRCAAPDRELERVAAPWIPLRGRAGDDRPLARSDRTRIARRLAAGPRDRALRPTGEGIRRDERARQGESAARHRPSRGRGDVRRCRFASRRDPCSARGCARRRCRQSAGHDARTATAPLRGP